MKQTKRRFKSKISQGLAAVLLLGQVFSLPLASDGWGAYTAYAAETGQAGAAAGQAESAVAEPATADAVSPSEAAPSGEGATPAFADIADSYAREEIAALAADGILSGTAPGLFAPRQPMTRAELAKIVSLASGLPESREEAARFADVPAGSWYSGYVGALVKSGITEGTSDTAFSPDQQVTREQLVVFFMRAMGLQSVADSVYGEPAFTDWDKVSDWAKPAVRLAARITFVQGIDNGDGTVSFNPGAPSERQALARLAYEFHRNRQPYLAKAGLVIQPDAGPPKEEPKPATGGGGGGFGGGGGGGVIAQPPSPPSAPSINQAGTINGDFTITTSGTFGPADGAGTAKLTGTLYINPGSAGEVTLQNVEAPSIVVQSGSSHSVRVRQVTAGNVRISTPAQTESVRLLALEGTQIQQTEIRSAAIIENQAGSAGQLQISGEAAGQAIELRGVFNEHVAVHAPGATLLLANPGNGVTTTIGSLEMAASGKVETRPGTHLNTLVVSANQAQITLSGGGTVATVEPAAGAQRTTLVVSPETKLDKLTLRGEVTLDCTAEQAKTLTIEADSSTGGNGFQLIASDSVKQIIADAQAKRIQEAIAALHSVNSYSPEVEQQTFSIRRMITATSQLSSFMLTEAEQQKLTETERALNAYALAEAKENLNVILSPGDMLYHVTGNLILPAAALWNTTVSWNVPVNGGLKITGEIIRPPYGSADETLAFSATLSRNGVTVTKDFQITIMAQPETPVTLAPSVTETVYSDAAWIRGTSEPKTKITIRDGSNHLVAEGESDSYGSFVAPLRRDVVAGEQLNIVASQYNKPSSEPTLITVSGAPVPTIVTEKPSYYSYDKIYTNTKRLFVSAEEPIAYRVTRENGEVLAAGFSGSYQSFHAQWNESLVAGEKLSITSHANGKLASGAFVRTVVSNDGMEGTTQTPVLYGSVEGSHPTVQLLVEKGAFATFRQDESIRADGPFESILIDGEHQLHTYELFNVSSDKILSVIAYAPGKQESLPLSINASSGETQEQSNKPWVSEQIVWGQIRFLAESNSVVYIKKSDGSLVGASYVGPRNPEDTYQNQTRTYYLSPYQVSNGDILWISVKERGKKESMGVPITVYGMDEPSGPLPGTETPENPAQQAPQPILRSAAIFPRGGLLELQTPVSQDTTFLLKKMNGKAVSSFYLLKNGSKLQFNINDPAIIKPGELVQITAQRYGAQESVPVLATVLAPSPGLQPTLLRMTTGYGYILFEGQAAPLARIKIMNAASGDVIASTETNMNGRFSVDVFSPRLSMKTPLQRLQIVSNRYDSIEATSFIDPPSLIETEAPQIIASELFVNGGIVKVGLSHEAVVWFINEESTYWAPGIIIGKGTPDIEISDYVLSADAKLYVVAQESGKLPSRPVLLDSYKPVRNIQASSPTMIGSINDSGAFFAWSGEPLAMLTVQNASGVIVGTGTADMTGRGAYGNWLYPIKAGESLQLRADAPGKLYSEPISVVVQAAEQTSAPVLKRDITEATSLMLVSVPPQTNQLIITDGAGYLLSNESVYLYNNSGGNKDIEISAPNGLKAGQQLLIYAKTPNLKLSAPATYTVLTADTTPTPTVSSHVYEGLTYQTINVSLPDELQGEWFLRKQDGTLIAQDSFYNGFTSLWLGQIPVTAGENLSFTVKSVNKKISSPVTLTVQPASVTSAPTVTGAVYTQPWYFSGFAERGATVRVKRSDGTVIGSSTANTSDGSYTIYLYPSVTEGETLQITATSPYKKESAALTVTVQPTPTTPSPTVTGTVYTTSLQLSGLSESFALVTLKRADGTSLQLTYANSDGSFTFNWGYSTVLQAGETLYVTAQSSYYMLESAPTAIIVQPPAQ